MMDNLLTIQPPDYQNYRASNTILCMDHKLFTTHFIYHRKDRNPKKGLPLSLFKNTIWCYDYFHL